MSAKLSRRLAPGGLAACAAAASLAAGCQRIAGIEDKAFVRGESAAASLPPRPEGRRQASGTPKKVIIAAKEFFYGTRRVDDKQTDPQAWRRIGIDLDGQCTSAEAPLDGGPRAASCILNPIRQKSLLEDGDDCRDNSLGRNVANVPSNSLGADFDALTNPAVYEGRGPTYVFVLEDYDDGADDPVVPATLYLTAPRPAPADSPEALWRPDSTREVIAGRTYRFDQGYRRGDVWVSGDRKVASTGFPLAFLARETELRADVALVTLTLGDGGRSGAIGNVGLAVGAEELTDKVRPLGIEVLYQTFATMGTPEERCAGAETFLNPVLQSVEANSDLPDVADGQARPVNATLPCSMLSVGVAFEAVPIEAVVEVAAPPPTFSCPPPVGAGGAGGAGPEE